jgi:hypothetical protein
MMWASQHAIDAVTRALAAYGQAPKTTAHITAEVHYSRVYVRQVLHILVQRGLVVQEGSHGQLVVWSLPQAPVLRVCGRCQVGKGLGEFHRDSRAPGGLKRLCRSCVKAAESGWQDSRACSVAVAS